MRDSRGMGTTIVPSRLHHHAFVVADQERTRHFYEDVLGMPLVATWCERETLRGKEREYCHTFFGLADGSALAFFQFADAADHAELAAATPASLNHVALAVDEAGQADLIAPARHPRRAVPQGRSRLLPFALHQRSRWPGGGVHLRRGRRRADQRARRADAHAELRRWLDGDRTPNNNLR